MRMNIHIRFLCLFLFVFPLCAKGQTVSNWYDQFYQVSNAYSTGIYYSFFTYPDSNLVIPSAWTGTTDINIGYHGMGFSFDPTDHSYAYGAIPNLPAVPDTGQSYTVDSFGFNYEYVRNNPLTTVTDSMIIEISRTTAGSIDSGAYSLKLDTLTNPSWTTDLFTGYVLDFTPRYSTLLLDDNVLPNDCLDSVKLTAPAKMRFAVPLTNASPHESTSTGTISTLRSYQIPLGSGINVKYGEHLVAYVYFKSGVAYPLGTSCASANWFVLLAGNPNNPYGIPFGQTPSNPATGYPGSYNCGLINNNASKYGVGGHFKHLGHNLLVPANDFYSEPNFEVPLFAFHVKFCPVPVLQPIAGAQLILTGATALVTDTVSGGVWSSSATGVATIGSTGLVHGVSQGSAVITYHVTNSCGTGFATYTVPVLNYTPGCNGTLQTLAGDGYAGYSGDGIPATALELNNPSGVAVDRNGNIYIADRDNSRIRKISASGIMTTFAGTTTSGYSGDGGAATAARLSYPAGVAVDTAGNVFIADTYNDCIREVNTAGIISTIAGQGYPGYSGDMGVASLATLSAPSAVAVDMSGNVYISDENNNRIREINTLGIINTIAGNGSSGYSGEGAATAVEINGVIGVTVDRSGNVYIADEENNRIRKITPAGYISTIAGNGIGAYNGDGIAATAAELNQPGGVVLDTAGNIYIGDGSNARIRKISTSGVISTIAGNGVTGFTSDGVPPAFAELNFPYGLALDASGNLYFADFGNFRVRQVIVKALIKPVLGASSVCQGATTPLADSTGGGRWSSSNTLVATAGTTGVVTGVAAGSAVISYIISGTCMPGYVTHAITVNPLPSAGSISGSSVCLGSTLLLTDGVSGGTWASSNTAVATIGTDGTVSGVNIGTTIISYRVTTVCGTALATDNFTVNGLPNAGTISGSTSVCMGSSVTLTDGSGSGTWSSSNIAVGTVSGGTVAGITAGTVIISYTVSTPCGTSYATAPETVNPLPVAGSVGGPSSVCQGASVTLTDGTLGGAWNSSSFGIASVSGGGLVTGVAAGTVIISYTVTTACGSALATTAMTVNPLPSAGAITGASSVCVGATIPLADGVTGGAWSSSNPAIGSVSGTGVTGGVAAGTVTISYTVSVACGSATATDVILVNPLPAAGVITGVAPVCEGSTLSLTDATGSGAWSSSEAGVAYVTGGTVTAVTAGTTTISYAVTNVCGTAYATAMVTVSPLPDAGTITGGRDVCAGVHVTLSDAAGGGTWYASNADAFVSSGGVVLGAAAGLDTISYKVTNSCGTASTGHVVNVIAQPYAGTISGPDSVCLYDIVTLIDTTSGGIWGATSAHALVSSDGSVAGLTPGNDTVIYVFTNACGSDTAHYALRIINCDNAVSPVSMAGEDITIFPNPAHDNITIVSTAAISSVTISNIIGQTVFSGTYTDVRAVIGMQQLAPGVYEVKVNDSRVFKVVKQ